MGFDQRYRFSVHAVILDQAGRVLQLKQTYGDGRWGLPGGAVEPGETLYQALSRECQEELGCTVHGVTLTGFYYHAALESQVGICRCELRETQPITLSSEHSEHRYFPLEELSPVQQLRVGDALEFRGRVAARVF